MTRSKWMGIAVIGLIVIFITSVITAAVMIDWNGGNDKASASPKATPVVAGGGCDNVTVATTVLRLQGFTDEQFVIGEENIDFSEPELKEAGSANFGAPVQSAQELVDHLGSNNPKAQAALAAVQEKYNYSTQQLLRADRWVAFQLKVNSEWGGNTAFVGGQKQDIGTRYSDKGDAGWLYVDDSACERVGDGEDPNGVVPAVRLGCNNPQTELPKPGSPEGGPRPCVGENCIPPVRKCIDGEVDPDGDGYCGTSLTGPEQQSSTDTHGHGATSGYPGRGHAEQVDQQQSAATPGGTLPTPLGTPAQSGGSPSGSHGGGNAGVGEPDNNTGLPDEPTNGNDPCAGQTSEQCVP